jgi:hypothetical protein
MAIRAVQAKLSPQASRVSAGKGPAERHLPPTVARVMKQMKQATVPARQISLPSRAIVISAPQPHLPARTKVAAAPRSSAPAALETPAPANIPAKKITITPLPAKTKKSSSKQPQELIEMFRATRKEAKATQTTKKQNGSLLSRLTQPKALCLIGAIGALKVAFAVLAVKIGPLAATNLVAQHAIAFLTPGAYVLAFALEVALKTTATIIAQGILPIVLPIISTIVVTTLAVSLTVYVGYLILQAMKEKVKAMLDKVPLGAGKIINSMLFSEEQADSTKAKAQTWGSYLTSFIPGSKAEDVDGSGDGDGSDDDSDVEEVEIPASAAALESTAATLPSLRSQVLGAIFGSNPATPEEVDAEDVKIDAKEQRKVEKRRKEQEDALVQELQASIPSPAELALQRTFKSMGIAPEVKEPHATGGLEALFAANKPTNPFILSRVNI